MTLPAGCSAEQPLDGPIALEVGAQETVLDKAQRDTMGLKWFADGNIGTLSAGPGWTMYAANGRTPMCVRVESDGRMHDPSKVIVAASDKSYDYLAGGPIHRDPATGKTFLIYHAELHRGSARLFYSVIGLAVQTDETGLAFRDLGVFYRPNLPPEKAKGAVEVGGGPCVVRDGCIHLYARDALDGPEGAVNLCVSRAGLDDVAGGKPAVWTKYYQGEFSEPALGGRSSPLEEGNPPTRWFDMSYNTAARKYLMVVAANTSPGTVQLFTAWSDDGLHWSARTKLNDVPGESFYPSIVDFASPNPRECGADFWIYNTWSKAGSWERWSDAAVVRRPMRVTQTPASGRPPARAR